jgi:hypothetical protein
MTDLDTRLRTGMAAAAERITTPDTAALAERLDEDRRPGRGRLPWLVAAAVLLVVVAGAIVVVSAGDDDGGGRVMTAPSSDPSSAATEPVAETPGSIAFSASFAPGWDILGTGMVAPDHAAGLAWTGRELVVVATTGAAWALDPQQHAWRELSPAPVPEPRADHMAAIWTGEEVVVVASSPGGLSSAWDPDTGRWRDLGEVPVAPSLAAYGGSASTWPTALVWTGERVIDPTRMAALDPTTGEWATMPLPDDLPAYTHLLFGGMVWDGEEAVLVGWTGDGLAWDATGSTYRVVPGSPDSVTGEVDVVPSSRVVLADGEVVVLAGLAGSGGAAALDARTGTWRRLPDVPGVGDEIGCPYGVAVVEGRPVVLRCDGAGVVVLGADGWEDTGAPADTAGCCIGRWVSTGDALVVWDSDTDTLNNPEAPYVRAWTWIPPG